MSSPARVGWPHCHRSLVNRWALPTAPGHHLPAPKTAGRESSCGHSVSLPQGTGSDRDSGPCWFRGAVQCVTGAPARWQHRWHTGLARSGLGKSPSPRAPSPGPSPRSASGVLQMRTPSLCRNPERQLSGWAAGGGHRTECGVGDHLLDDVKHHRTSRPGLPSVTLMPNSRRAAARPVQNSKSSLAVSAPRRTSPSGSCCRFLHGYPKLLAPTGEPQLLGGRRTETRT